VEIDRVVIEEVIGNPLGNALGAFDDSAAAGL
jgi:hypothetical protein